MYGKQTDKPFANWINHKDTIWQKRKFDLWCVFSEPKVFRMIQCCLTKIDHTFRPFSICQMIMQHFFEGFRTAKSVKLITECYVGVRGGFWEEMSCLVYSTHPWRPLWSVLSWTFGKLHRKCAYVPITVSVAECVFQSVTVGCMYEYVCVYGQRGLFHWMLRGTIWGLGCCHYLLIGPAGIN